MRWINGQRPEPGRHVSRQTEKITVVEKESSKEIDVDAIAQAVIKAINKNINTGNVSVAQKDNDVFDTTDSLAKLADTMTVQRGKRESNFEDLGAVKETKKDIVDTDKTIDILKDIE